MATFLERRTWRELRTIAHTYNIKFDNNHTKLSAQQYLSQILLKDNKLQHKWRQFNQEEKSALMTLKACNGVISKVVFEKQFGEIRKYRPWREDAPTNPWRKPISIAEKLWYMGFFEIDKRMRQIFLPDEVSNCLPPVPIPSRIEQPITMQNSSVEQLRVLLVRDVAILLGMLQYDPIHLLHEKWLPPYVIHKINDRMAVPEILSNLRSEFQCKRVRLVHYLAKVMGLYTSYEGVPIVSAQAWEWLSLPYTHAYMYIIESWLDDLKTHEPVWEQFRFSPIDPQTVTFLRELPDGNYTMASLIETLQVQCLGKVRPASSLRAVLQSPMGIATLDKGIIQTYSVDSSAPKEAIIPSQLVPHPDAIIIRLGNEPNLIDLAKVISFASLQDNLYVIDIEAVRRATEQAITSTQLFSLLERFLNQQVTDKRDALLAIITKWYQQVKRVQIAEKTLLTVTEVQDMERIRSDWRLRPFLGEQLSTHHLVVQDIHNLKLALARRNLLVVNTSTKPHTKPFHNADYLYLAVRTTQKIGQIISPKVHIPGIVVNHLQDFVTLPLDQLDYIVEETVEQLRQAIRGEVDSYQSIETGNTIQIEQAVRHAYQELNSVRIRYFSPLVGYETERTIYPQMIYESNKVIYIEAWCDLDNAIRTFRMDRILEILS